MLILKYLYKNVIFVNLKKSEGVYKRPIIITLYLTLRDWQLFMKPYQQILRVLYMI